MAELLKTFDLTPLDAQMILVWAVAFVILWQILARVLFGPYLKLVETRDAQTTGAEDNAKSLTAKADELMLKYEDRITQARIAGMKEKNETLSKARTEAQAITEQADAKAQEKIQKSREELNARLATLKSELERDCESMAASITEKLRSSGAHT